MSAARMNKKSINHTHLKRASVGEKGHELSLTQQYNYIMLHNW